MKYDEFSKRLIPIIEDLRVVNIMDELLEGKIFKKRKDN
jgi:hypothetical protein